MTGFLRLLLFPFSLLYGVITRLRNVFFDMNWMPSYQPTVKTIAVGNLNTGGTGKTPFTEWLIRNLGENHKIAVVSRGYGRKSRGFHWVESKDHTDQCGDEALQIKRKYPECVVAVSEKRKPAIQRIEKECPEVDLVILDDAFQHRHVRAHIYILLTTYKAPYFKDYLLPSGNLRESRKGAKRADFIVMTKCPENLSKTECKALYKKVSPRAYQQLFFAKQGYGTVFSLFHEELSTSNFQSALVVSGIANDDLLVERAKDDFGKVTVLKYTDHVDYKDAHMVKIAKKFRELNEDEDCCVLTTEKDAVKWHSFRDLLNDIPIFVLPFQHVLEKGPDFLNALQKKIRG